MKINYISETAVSIQLGNTVSTDLNRDVIRLSKFIEKQSFAWMDDIVPAYNALSIYVDYSFYNQHDSLKAFFEKIYQNFLNSGSIDDDTVENIIEIDVLYEGEDLEHVASYCSLTNQEVIQIHSYPVYTVAMIGFSPGFPYLLGLDSRLVVPRRETPRTQVPKGSVAIGGNQTGIYPQPSPGGWHIIGKTDIILYDRERKQPCLLSAGDKVIFKPINL